MLFHVGFVFEGELAAGAIAVKMGSFLAAKWAVMRGAIFTTSKPGFKKDYDYNKILYFVNLR